VSGFASTVPLAMVLPATATPARNSLRDGVANVLSDLLLLIVIFALFHCLANFPAPAPIIGYEAVTGRHLDVRQVILVESDARGNDLILQQ
jgi:hypothetical protein